ncbi:MAG: alpha-glucan family phosphorylase [Atribacterota bacterium]|nr:alpha-glucan family phosphorylase [Atribacterota bacterium]MDD4895144.1 alpha-glucan family phosphorylase [Atribacterota bacterium]MDD5637207.1 alpha-glucan family phosphorylase [Atribacterota bacterium]
MEARKSLLYEHEECIKGENKIAYFSMEICVDTKIPTYSGGLGILAGDTIRSSADLGVPLVGITLLYKKGYLRQDIDEQGYQQELPEEWNPQDKLIQLPARIQVEIEKRNVIVQSWMYMIKGVDGDNVPVYFLDTDLPENSEYDRSLSYYLYGGDERYRLAQEIVLGIGGVKMLKELGYKNISRYHMNEGHASLLALELLCQFNNLERDNWDIDQVKKMCVFTTHTPVLAGMDQFPYQLVEQVLGNIIPYDLLKSLAGEEKLNMTQLALNLSHYVNGVAKRHGLVSREMFPGYHIDSITNGVHSATWTGKYFTELYDQYIPGWKSDPFSLRYALNIPDMEVWKAHQKEKEELIAYINKLTNLKFEKEVFTIGFARRATAYKRADLIFYNLNQLIDIASRKGNIQLVFAGKAHPRDQRGKELIQKIINTSLQLPCQENIKIVYLKNYNMNLGKILTSGVDLWLNTPRKPQEASGTSGMKAAHNGIPSFSILDGWWVEGCIEGITGWSIGSAANMESIEQEEADSLYKKLEIEIIPTYYHKRNQWINMMRHCIAINASFFNTHRMVLQYVSNAYLYS